MSHRLDRWLATVISRRAMLGGGLALVGMPAARLLAAPSRGVRFQSTPFTLGVASGDPTPDGVVLWTRLAPRPLEGGGMPDVPVDVTWEIARDERMRQVVQEGRITARPELAHSVHVEADGLEPDRWYWYRFRVSNEESPVGRTRTLPRGATDATRLRFAFGSCQHYEQGYYTAYRHMVGEDLDAVFFLGDYIYEGAGQQGRPRMHTGGEILTLADYRNRYALYKSDPDLQAAHAAFPWFMTWDDHEVDNNYADAISQDDDPAEAFLGRRAGAYQAYYEHMPLRRTSMPRGASLQLYRQFRYGTLASFFILDTRQYRTNQPCGDGTKVPCPEAFNQFATLLGREQERWLHDALEQSSTRWNVVPQQVMMAPADRQPGDEVRLSMDQWPGYVADRDRLLNLLHDRRIANPVVLTGDIHSNWVNDLKRDFRDERSATIGTELVVTSISSGGDGRDAPPTLGALLSENPFVKFHNQQRGYVSCELTPGMLTARYQVVGYVTRPGAPLVTRATFVVEDGHPGAKFA